MRVARFLCLFGWSAWLLFGLSSQIFCAAQSDAGQKRLRVAVVDFSYTGENLRNVGREVAEGFRSALKQNSALSLIDAEATRAAADGFGYVNLLNFERADARAFGIALDADFYLLGRVTTAPNQAPAQTQQTEARAYLFLVSARTGNLAHWAQFSVTDAFESNALRRLQEQLTAAAATFVTQMRAAEQTERAAEVMRAQITSAAPLIPDAPAPDAPDAQGLRLPAPYRRLQPQPTEAARAARVEAMVDVEIELDETGEVQHAEITRWAGYGLDEAVLTTVRQLHFRPATRNGAPVPLRVLLRYNFRLKQ